MRSLALILLLLVAQSGRLIAQALQPPSCRKNVIIYFDNSDSMKYAARVGRDLTIRDLMMSFLDEAVRSPQLIADSDSLKIKLFVDNATEVWSSTPGVPLTQKVRREVLKEVKDAATASAYQAKGKRLPDNDYVELALDFERELTMVPVGQGTTTYLLVFSDFLYDPGRDKRNATEWELHSKRLKEKLVDLETLFEARQGKLVIWYQKNNKAKLIARTQGKDSVALSENPDESKEKKDGVDLNGLFHSSYSHQLDDAAGIPDLVKAVSKEFRKPLLIKEPRFLFGGDGLKLRLDLENPNCDSIDIREVRVDRIGEGDTLAGPSAEKVEQPLAPGPPLPIGIHLQGSPGLGELRSKFLRDEPYDVTVAITSDDLTARPVTLRLHLGDEAFNEEIAAGVEAVMVRHLIPRFDRLFVRLKLAGNLLGDATLRAEGVESSGLELKLIEPTDKYTISPTTLDEPRIFIFSLHNDTWSRKTLSHIDNLVIRFKAGRDEGKSGPAPPLSKELEFPRQKVIYKNYSRWEWFSLVFIFLSGVGIRVHYARKRI